MKEKLMNFFMGYGYRTDDEILAYLAEGMDKVMRDFLRAISEESFEKWKAENPDRKPMFMGFYISEGKK